MAHGAQKFPHDFDNISKANQLALSDSMKKALISLGLEGISLSKESIADLHLFDAGKISKKEMLKRVLLRARPPKK